MFRCNPSKTSVNIIKHLKSYLGISFYTLSPISAIYFCSLISPKVTWTKAGFKAALWARREGVNELRSVSNAGQKSYSEDVYKVFGVCCFVLK